MEQRRVIPLDSIVAMDAALYGLKHQSPLVDSIIYAAAKKCKAKLWTQDVDFEGLDGVSYFERE